MSVPIYLQEFKDAKKSNGVSDAYEAELPLKLVSYRKP